MMAWSFLSDDIKDWNCSALFSHKSDHQEAYLAYMLYYIVKAETGAKNGDERPGDNGLLQYLRADEYYRVYHMPW